jgi:pimeloyl-ACP methyl ester carboxylesterase
MWQMAGYTDNIGACHQILFDHRGHGRSGRPTNVEDHRLEEYVADVIAVLDAVGVDRAVMIGYSFGASVVYAAAGAYPDHCSAVVGIGGLRPPDDVSAKRPSIIDRLRERGTRAIIEEMAAEEDEPCPTWLVDNLSTTDAEMFALQLEGCLNAATEWEHFSLITAPALIVCGELEDDGEAALAASTLVNGTAIVLPGYGHLQAFWHGEVTAPMIRDFLTSNGLLIDSVRR